jgi:hypothetical protein
VAITYSSGTQVGNTGLPTTTSGHVPVYMEGLAVDAAGDVYTVNGWDEPHYDIIKRSGVDGKVILHSGHCVSDLLEGIAIDPDGRFAYVVSIWAEHTETGMSGLRQSLFKVDLSTNYSPAGVGSKSKVVWECKLYDGPATYPDNFTATDKATANIPIRSCYLAGNRVYLPDSLGQRVLIVDKISGTPFGTINNVPIACGCAVNPAGKVWVGANHTEVRVYEATGAHLFTPIVGLNEVRAITISGDTMFVGDMGASRVKKYFIDGMGASHVGDFGSPMQAGDRAFDKIAGLRALASDSAGNLFIADRPGDAGRLQKVTPTFGTQLWQQACWDFSSVASFSSANPNILISSNSRVYQINRSDMTWQYLGLGRVEDDYFGHFDRTDEGPPRVITLNGRDWYYMPSRDGGIAVYEVMPAVAGRGPTLRFASCLARNYPLPDGTLPYPGMPGNQQEYMWSWNDGVSTHPSDNNIIFKSPADVPYQFEVSSFGVGPGGTLWLAVENEWFPPGPQEKSSIWVIPHSGFTPLGSPIYKWESAGRLFSFAQAAAMLGLVEGEEFKWKAISAAEDIYYALGICSRTTFPQYPDLHPGGNVLAAFRKPDGVLLWHIVLPKVAAGIAAILGGKGGVLVGGDPDKGTISHYSKTGELLKNFGPGLNLTGSYPTGNDWIHGRFDSLQCLQCDRGPDGILDVFAQDNVNQRIVWYRVDDREQQTMADTIKFTPRSGWASRMNGGKFQGSNVQAGPYTDLYTVVNAQPTNEVTVDLGDYKFLRYLSPNGSYGNVAEIEFYKDGVKQVGVPFGSPGSWGNSGATFEKAFDGNLTTFFDAPTADGNFVGMDLPTQPPASGIPAEIEDALNTVDAAELTLQDAIDDLNIRIFEHFNP